MTNILKKATFGLWIFLLITMIAATILEKLYRPCGASGRTEKI